MLAKLSVSSVRRLQFHHPELLGAPSALHIRQDFTGTHAVPVVQPRVAFPCWFLGLLP